MQHRDFFQHISDFDHSLGIFLTFTLDRDVIEKIKDNNSGRMIILHDIRHGVTLTNLWDCKVLCIPVSPAVTISANCFHSKLALLKGPSNARLITGSLNLSKSAFRRTKEVCCVTDLEYGSETLKRVLSFLESLKVDHKIWNDIIDEFRLVGKQPSANTDRSLEFITNTSSDAIANKFLASVTALGPKGYPVLHIATPFVSRRYDGRLESFMASLSPKQTRFYLRTKQPLPPEIHELSGTVQIREPKGKTRERFHAKIIALEYDDEVIAYVGSANFTKQGFFLNLDEGANNENGVVIVAKEKQDILEWFAKGWSVPVSVDKWVEDPKLFDVTDSWKTAPYALAERSDSKTVNVQLFLPSSDVIRQVRVNGSRQAWSQGGVNFYETSLEEENDILTIQIPDFGELKVGVFDESKFEASKGKDGESLFMPLISIMEDSVNEFALKRAIRDQGIRVGAGSLQIIEPPLLEQIYYNVKEHIRAIQRRKLPKKDFLQELHNELHENSETTYHGHRYLLRKRGDEFVITKNGRLLATATEKQLCSKRFIQSIAREEKEPLEELIGTRGKNGAIGLYLLLHLYGVFKKKEWNEFADVCRSRIEYITSRTNIVAPRLFLRYADKWLSR